MPALGSNTANAISADDLRKLGGGVQDFLTGIMEDLGELNKEAAEAQKVVILSKQLDLQSELFGMKTDNDNNSFANWIARIGNQSEGIHDAELAAAEQPAYDACANITVSQNLKDAQIAASQANSLMRGRADRGSHRRGEGGKVIAREIPQDQMNEITRIVKSAAQSTAHKGDGVVELAPGMDMAMLLGSSPDSKALSGTKLNSARDMIFLATPPSRIVITDDMTEIRKAELLSQKIRQNAPNKILNGILSKRTSSPDGPSVLETRDFMAQMKWAGNPTDSSGFLQMVTTSAALHPENILRSRAVMKAFKVYNAVEAYEASLANEAATATILSERLN